MSRSRVNSEGPSFFPFISVLLCVLGVLIFLTGGIASTSVNSASNNVDFHVPGVATQGQKKPIVFDCRSDEVLVKGTGLQFQSDDIEWIADASRFDQSELGRFLATTARQADERYILLFVRPKGIDTFNRMKTIIDYRNYDRSRSEVTLDAADPIPLPPAVSDDLKARIQLLESGFGQWRLVTWGPLSSSDVRELNELSDAEPWRRAVRTARQQSADKELRIDLGTELIPEKWKVRIVEGTGG